MEFKISVKCKSTDEVSNISAMIDLYLFGSRFKKDDLDVYQCRTMLDTLSEFNNSFSWCLDYIGDVRLVKTDDYLAVINEAELLVEKLKEIFTEEQVQNE